MPTVNYSYQAAFNPDTYRPVFDPTGTLAANLVSNEKHTITAANGRDFHFIVPLFSPFFAYPGALSLVYQPAVGPARTLIEGIDYLLAFEFMGASRGCSKPVYGGISFLNTKLAGVITLAYRTLGGNWNISLPEITQILANTIANPRVTAWEQVINAPATFPVIDHEWNLVDMVGASDIVAEIHNISLAIANRPASTLPISFQLHLDDFENPHLVTKAQVGLSLLNNYATATNAQTAEGSATDLYVTPAGVKAAVDASAPGSSEELQSHITDESNPHDVTKDQVGLGDVQDFPMASNLEAAEGTATNRYMSPAAVKHSIDQNVPSASNTTKGKVALNQGNALNDDVNAVDALTAAGLAAMLNAGDSNALIAAVQEASPPVELSVVPGNLIEQRPDGLYYGITAPPDVAVLYIDAVNGNDLNIGTRPLPMKNIPAAVARGPSGINRTLYIHEDQTHWVDPANGSKLRGGLWNIFPYGPRCDALAPVNGDSNLMQAAGMTLNANITSKPLVTADYATNGVFQVGGALYPVDKANITAWGVNFICAAPNVSGAPISAYAGTFHQPEGEGNWYIRGSTITLPDVNSRFLSENKIVPISCSMNVVSFTGPGKFADCNSKLFTLNASAGVIGGTGSSAAVWRSYLVTGAPVGAQFFSFNTNLLPDPNAPLASPLTLANSPMVMAYLDATSGGLQTRSSGVGDANLSGLSFHNEGYYAIKMGVRADGYFGIGGYSRQAWSWYSDPSGNMVSAGNVSAYSDPRLKENIRPIRSAMAKIKMLNGVYFRWKEGIAHTLVKAGKEDIGILANQVEEVFPEIVSESIDIDSVSYKTVAYDKLVAVLIEGMKELQDQIDVLKNGNAIDAEYSLQHDTLRVDGVKLIGDES